MRVDQARELPKQKTERQEGKAGRNRSYVFHEKREYQVERHLDGDGPAAGHDGVDGFRMKPMNKEGGEEDEPPLDPVGSPVVDPVLDPVARRELVQQRVQHYPDVEHRRDPKKPAYVEISSGMRFL